MSDSNKLVEAQIQVYLDDVTAHLLTDGLNAEDTESVCDGLRAQIYDMASHGGIATEDSVAQSIASMEDPAKFRASTEQAPGPGHAVQDPSTSKRTSRLLASIALYVAIAGPAIAIISGVIASFLQTEGWEFGSFILFSAAIVALLFGAISRKDARGRAAIMVSIGTIVGYFVLLFGALFFE